MFEPWRDGSSKAPGSWRKPYSARVVKQPTTGGQRHREGERGGRRERGAAETGEGGGAREGVVVETGSRACACDGDVRQSANQTVALERLLSACEARETRLERRVTGFVLW